MLDIQYTKINSAQQFSQLETQIHQNVFEYIVQAKNVPFSTIATQPNVYHMQLNITYTDASEKTLEYKIAHEHMYMVLMAILESALSQMPLEINSMSTSLDNEIDKNVTNIIFSTKEELTQLEQENITEQIFKALTITREPKTIVKESKANADISSMTADESKLAIDKPETATSTATTSETDNNTFTEDKADNAQENKDPYANFNPQAYTDMPTTAFPEYSAINEHNPFQTQNTSQDNSQPNQSSASIETEKAKNKKIENFTEQPMPSNHSQEQEQAGKMQNFNQIFIKAQEQNQAQIQEQNKQQEQSQAQEQNKQQEYDQMQDQNKQQEYGQSQEQSQEQQNIAKEQPIASSANDNKDAQGQSSQIIKENEPQKSSETATIAANVPLPKQNVANTVDNPNNTIMESSQTKASDMFKILAQENGGYTNDEEIQADKNKIQLLKEKLFNAKHDTSIDANEICPKVNLLTDYKPQYDIASLFNDIDEYRLHDTFEHIETDVPWTTLNKYFIETMQYATEVEKNTLEDVYLGQIPRSEFMTNITGYLDRTYQLTSKDKKILCDRVASALFSYYTLISAIKDPEISDIKIFDFNRIIVKVHGKQKLAVGTDMINHADYLRFVQGIVYMNHVLSDGTTGFFVDKQYDNDYNLRINISFPLINASGMPILQIRKEPKRKITLNDLIDRKMLTPEMATYLLDKAATAKGIVISGPSASGKTHLMNALIDYIPKDKSVFCGQESDELFSNVHPNIMFQHIIRDKRSRVIYGLNELGQNGLVCDIQYFLIGECKGAEVRDMLRASNTGHKCWCTVHSESSIETIPRLADYVKYGSDYSLEEAIRMLKDLEIIVYVQNYKITEITEIVGYDEEQKQIIYKPIYRR